MSTMLIYLLVPLGILALMFFGFLVFKPRKHDTKINIDFDAPKGDESHGRF